MVVEIRSKWGSKAEFVLAIVGYGVGLGNIWRFPYLCYRSGGGGFLVPYLIMLFFSGIPLFYLEAALGQFSSSAIITIFEKLAPALKGCAYAAIVVNIIASMQYNLLISYPILFLVDSFSGTLPWKTCGNWWNTDDCVVLTGEVQNITGDFKTSADEYFHNKILRISNSPEEFGSIVTPLTIVNICSWIILFLCLRKGIQSLGKIVYFTASFPYLMLIILFIRGVTLPGAWDGIKAYLIPEWNELVNLNVWADAAVQIFFSLGPGWGGIVNMASYNYFRNNIQIDSTLLPLFNSFTSIFAGFVVFSVLGYLSHQTGIPVKHVANEGPALAFITYPEALGLLPVSRFFSICFFLMLYTLGIDSCLVQIETCITCITDQWPQLRRKKDWVAFFTVFFLAAGSFLFVFQNGMYLIQIFDYFAYSLTVILICILEIVMICYCYGMDRFNRDLSFMLSKRSLNKFWIVSWKFVTPIILIFIFFTVMIFSSNLTYNGVLFPPWCIALGWCSSLVSLLIIPGYFLYKMTQFKGNFKERIENCLHENDWGPADKADRMEWEIEMKRVSS